MSIMKTDSLMTLLKYINLIKFYSTAIIEVQVPRVRQAVIAAVGTTRFQLLRPLLETTLVKMRPRMMTIMIHFILTRQLPLARTLEAIVNDRANTSSPITTAPTAIYYCPTVYIQNSLIVILPLVIICTRVTVTPVPKEKDW